MLKLKRACSMCPFRKDSLKGWLGRSRAEGIIRSVSVLGESFPCHKTINYENTGEGERTPSTQECAGSMIMLHKQDTPNQVMQVMERLGYWNPKDLQDLDLVFDTEDEFIEHHDNTLPEG